MTEVVNASRKKDFCCKRPYRGLTEQMMAAPNISIDRSCQRVMGEKSCCLVLLQLR